MKFNRSMIVKAGAAIIIIAFVLELFVVMTYAPAQTPTTDTLPTPVANITSGTSMVNVNVKNFQPNLVFVCNSSQSLTSAIQHADLIAGSAVQIGSNANGNLYTVRVKNATGTQNAAIQLENALSNTCDNLVVLRQADVTFNASKGTNFTTGNSSVFISKYALDSYRDQYGKIPSALISNVQTKSGDVISTQAYARIQAGRLVPGSLILEQTSQTPEVKQFETKAKVISFGDTVKIDFVYPWEARLFNFGGVENLNATIQPQVNSIVTFASNDSNVANVIGNATGVIRVDASDGKLLASVLDSFIDKAQFQHIASKYNAPVVFPTSRALIQVNASNAQAVMKILNSVPNATVVQYIDGNVEAINFNDFTLNQFTATLYANASIGDVVKLRGFAVITGSNVGQVSALQQ